MADKAQLAVNPDRRADTGIPDDIAMYRLLLVRHQLQRKTTTTILKLHRMPQNITLTHGEGGLLGRALRTRLATEAPITKIKGNTPRVDRCQIRETTLVLH